MHWSHDKPQLHPWTPLVLPPNKHSYAAPAVSGEWGEVVGPAIPHTDDEVVVAMAVAMEW